MRKPEGSANKVGDTFRKYGNGPYHVRAFVDGLVIARKWLNSRQHWHYEAFSYYELDLYGIDQSCSPIADLPSTPT